MTPVPSTHMILLGFLLLINSQTAAPAASAAPDSRSCVSADELTDRKDKFMRNYWNKLSVLKELPQRDERTCALAVKEMRGDFSGRSTSPWRYSLNREDDRIPPEIPFANCLCQGCIINRREDFSYNSVPVVVTLKVLRKSPCPGDASKHTVKNDFIPVPVACTCVVPKYAK